MLRVSLFCFALVGLGLCSSGCDGPAKKADPPRGAITDTSSGGSQGAGGAPSGGSQSVPSDGLGASSSTGADASSAAPGDTDGGQNSGSGARPPEGDSGTNQAGAATIPELDTAGTGGLGAAGGAAETSVGGSPAAGGAPSAGTSGAPDPYALPTTLPTVQLEVNEADVQTLEEDPFNAEDIPGAFTDENGVRYEAIDVNYRGAYALETLIMDELPQRNWKLKFSKDQTYRNRREWNFNFEQHLRQKLAYDLMKFAGVHVAEPRHVLLEVNGVMQGLYLEYEDPDSKAWLTDRFGDDTGDLFKAAHDVPGEPRYFATLEFLGETDEDYFLHYDKKTNNDPPLDTDYSSLREFLRQLNAVSDEEFPAWLEASFDVDRFISYLVVASFASHWDGYPQRPKNFWLCQIPSANRWAFVPWDLDSTFQPKSFYLNVKGAEASVFYQFDQFEEFTGRNPEEGTERPLVRRMMLHEEYRTRYIQRYREALSSFLDRDFLLDRINGLEALVQANAPEADVTELLDADEVLREFVDERYATVTAQIATLP